MGINYFKLSMKNIIWIKKTIAYIPKLLKFVLFSKKYKIFCLGIIYKKMVELTRKEYNTFAKNRSIVDPQNMLTKALLITVSRYDSGRKITSTSTKLLDIGLEKIAKIKNIWKFELSRAQKLQRKSKDELKDIARLRRIKNIEELTKEDLIIALLKSKASVEKKKILEKLIIKIKKLKKELTKLNRWITRDC